MLAPHSSSGMYFHLAMPALRFRIFVLAVLLTACMATPVPESQTNSSEPTTKTYGNPAYGISLTYPAEYAIREYGPEMATIGTLSGETLLGVLEIEIARSGNEPGEDDYDMFVANTLRNSCAADGPSGSYSCTDVISRDPVKTPSGLTADEIYLKSEYQNVETDELVTDERGPFTVFNLGATAGGSGFTVLILRAPTAVPVSEIDEQLIRTVRDSVQLLKVEDVSSTPGRSRAKEGEFCGGIAGFLCEDGLVCRYDGNYPDAAGTCARPGGA